MAYNTGDLWLYSERDAVNNTKKELHILITKGARCFHHTTIRILETNYISKPNSLEGSPKHNWGEYRDSNWKCLKRWEWKALDRAIGVE